jgi:DNA helicase II / ATP-dependent DNA helicase PcrA
LEFDVVFLAGMAEGVFLDYRTIGKARETQDESRPTLPLIRFVVAKLE